MMQPKALLKLLVEHFNFAGAVPWTKSQLKKKKHEQPSEL